MRNIERQMKNKKDISFILPTNRNYEQFSKKVIDNINSLNFFDKTYEIIVISPQEISGDNVVYVKEEETTSGCVNGYNEGYKKSTGEYIILCSDDHYFDFNCPSIIDVLESAPFSPRKYKIICLPTNKHDACKLPDYTDCGGIIARYPVFSRETIENHLGGYVYHPAFKHHYPDNWLGYWLNQQGESAIEYSQFDMITFSNSCYKIHDDHDEEVFKALIKNYKLGDTNYVAATTV